MDFKLLTIEDKDLAVFKRDMQEAFVLVGEAIVIRIRFWNL